MTYSKKNAKICSMKKALDVIVKNPINGIARISLNEPSTYNALSTKMLTALISAFKNLNKDHKTRIIIIEGAGKGFSAGHSLKEIKKIKTKSNYQKLFNLCSKLMLEIVEGKKPVIAKVHGAAFAAGCQLVASCDLAISSDDAIFATPGVNIGLFCSTPMVAVSRNVSRKKVMKMLLTGDHVNAKHAKEIGLINDYHPISKLEKEVLNLAKKIASKSNITIKIGKKAFYKQLEMPLNKAYKYTSKVMTANMMKFDAKEGVSAFLEKRNPIWKNK
jgi:enoyl-CoA hydratase/carnithine racemase|tara:strand:+ start:509 stop:1330 length:822 start_codon:yes stop_codon:yes gene_type:complete